MRDELLEKARRQAERAEPSVRAAALLRMARAELGGDAARARETLVQAMDAVRELPRPLRDQLLDEAREVAAAVAPESLADVPVNGHHGSQRFESMRIVQTMLSNGHVDAAFNYLLEYDDPGSFPFLSVGGVLQQMERGSPESDDRRLKLLRRAVEMWRGIPAEVPFVVRGRFVDVFGHLWKELPAKEALAVAQQIVAQAAGEPDSGGQFGYPDGVHFSSARQHRLFQILHVLRRLDPALAQSLIDSNDELAKAARRYPDGRETMREEAEVEMERRKAEGKAHSDGYILCGSGGDMERQFRLMEAVRSGDFEPSIQDALEKYAEDIAPETHNYAPKEYWPSTGAFRSVFYEAGKRLGTDAARLLERVPDDDLRLFATIELAAALGGAPASSIRSMRQPRPRDARGRIVGGRSRPMP